MSFFRDRQIRRYTIFLVLFSILLLGINLMFSNSQIDSAKEIYTMQNEAIVSSLLEQGVPKEVAANALQSDTVSEGGKQLLKELGMDRQSKVQSIPGLIRFQQSAFSQAVILSIVLILLLVTGTAVFFWYRKRLYLQANKVISQYIDGDFSNHLPQNSEGAIFQLFSSVEQLATIMERAFFKLCGVCLEASTWTCIPQLSFTTAPAWRRVRTTSCSFGISLYSSLGEFISTL